MSNRAISTELIELGERIRKRRQEMKLSQESFAEKAGISVNTVSRIEGGQTAMSVEMLHKYKYFVVYEEIDNSLRSLNNDSSIVHIKMKNIISKGIKRSMEVDFYKLMDFKYKQKKDMPEAWNIIIGDVDKFLVDFLKNFGIDMDLLYTTNVGVLK